MPDGLIGLFQGELFLSIEPAEIRPHSKVCWMVFEVVLFELEEFVHPLEVHDHPFNKAVIVSESPPGNDGGSAS